MQCKHKITPILTLKKLKIMARKNTANSNATATANATAKKATKKAAAHNAIATAEAAANVAALATIAKPAANEKKSDAIDATAVNAARVTDAIKRALKLIKEEALSLRAIVATIYDNKEANADIAFVAKYLAFENAANRHAAIKAGVVMLKKLLPIVHAAQIGDTVKHEPAKLVEVAPGVYEAKEEANVWAILDAALSNIDRTAAKRLVTIGHYYNADGDRIDTEEAKAAKRATSAAKKEAAAAKREEAAKKTLGLDGVDIVSVKEISALDLLRHALAKCTGTPAAKHIVDAMAALAN